jgi:hypothetical protein
VGNATTGTVTGLVGGVTYFFAVTAVATNGAESAYSSEVSYTPPLPTRSAPAIALTSPADGACYPASTCIDLCATVAANGHAITEVQFYNGATLIGSVASAPYSFSWNNVCAGTCSISAKALYDSGGTAGSAAVNVTVAPGPSGLTFAADSGTISAPFVDSGGTLSQPVETTIANGGRAVYDFTVLSAGNYLVSAMVIAPGDGQNSFWVNIDAEPADPWMIWDIPICSALTSQTVSWRGNGGPDSASAQYRPKVFTLSAGQHQLIILGREANTTLGAISIAAAPPPLQLHAAPGGSVVFSGTAQAAQKYNVLRSQDLKAWTVIGTVTTDASGSFTFSDPTAASRSCGFYRLQTITVPLPKLELRVSPGGSLTLFGSGPAGQMFNVLRSPDLKVWTVIGVVAMDAGGSFQFIDPTANSRPRGFYRLQSSGMTAPRLQLQAMAGGPVILTGIGQAGQTFNVLCSQDLATWTLIGAMTLDATGSGQFTDAAGNSRPHCMYRLQGQ